MSKSQIIRFDRNPAGFGETPDQLDGAMFDSDLPTQHTHFYVQDEVLELYLGVWDTTAMVEVAGPYGCDEFMWVLDGEVDIINNRNAARESVTAGEAFIVPKGYSCQWSQQSYLRKYFVIFGSLKEGEDENTSAQGIIKPQYESGMQNLSNTEPFVIMGSQPLQKSRLCYQNSAGDFSVTNWQSAPFESEQRAHPRNDFVCVERGSLTLTEAAGEVHRFNAGDAFFIPRGTLCSWRNNSDVRAIFTSQQSR